MYPPEKFLILTTILYIKRLITSQENENKHSDSQKKTSTNIWLMSNFLSKRKRNWDPWQKLYLLLKKVQHQPKIVR